jgi:septal ring factor EnvC (AmiA/AmiB activator)
MANKAQNVVTELLPPESAGRQPVLPMEASKSSGSFMWKALLQLRVLLPYLPRLLQLVNGAPPQADTRELRQGVDELQSTHRDLRRQVQDQGVGLKRIEEQIIRLREEIERHGVDQSDLLSELKSANDKLRTLAVAAIVLLSLVTVMSGVALALLLRH